MNIKIEDTVDLDIKMEDLCDRMGLGYGAASAHALSLIASECENRLAVFPDEMKVGAAYQVISGGAKLTVRRGRGFWSLVGMSEARSTDKCTEKLSIRQKFFLNSLSMSAAA